MRRGDSNGFQPPQWRLKTRLNVYVFILMWTTKPHIGGCRLGKSNRIKKTEKNQTRKKCCDALSIAQRTKSDRHTKEKVDTHYMLRPEVPAEEDQEEEDEDDCDEVTVRRRLRARLGLAYLQEDAARTASGSCSCSARPAGNYYTYSSASISARRAFSPPQRASSVHWISSAEYHRKISSAPKIV